MLEKRDMFNLYSYIPGKIYIINEATNSEMANPNITTLELSDLSISENEITVSHEDISLTFDMTTKEEFSFSYTLVANDVVLVVPKKYIDNNDNDENE